MTAFPFVRLFYPVRIPATQNAWVSDDFGTSTISAGVYWAYYGGDLLEEIPGLPSLYNAIRQPNDEPTFQRHQATGYDYSESLEYSFGTASLQLQFGSVSFTMDKRIWGWPEDYDQTETATATSPAIIQSPLSTIGQWLPASIQIDAQDLRSYGEREIYASTQPVYERTKIVPMREIRRVRTFRWEWVPGLRVMGGEVRGAEFDYREVAGVGPVVSGYESDGDAVGLRLFWEAVSSGIPFIAAYDEDWFGPQDDGAYEVLRLSRPDQHESFEALLEDQTPAGEFYTVDIEALVIGGGGYDY